MSTQLDAAIKLVLDDVARRIAGEVRAGRTPDAEHPLMRMLEGVAALYPSTYKQWEGPK